MCHLRRRLQIKDDMMRTSTHGPGGKGGGQRESEVMGGWATAICGSELVALTDSNVDLVLVGIPLERVGDAENGVCRAGCQ